MRSAVRVVINCAGEGRRLGLGTTKALVSVMGEPLIAWHLRMLREVDDVVVVVGYQAEQVIEAVRPLRPDAIFAFNHDYATTGTAASLAKGCRGAGGDVISLDGDLLVHPEDFGAFLHASRPCLGVAPATTTHAVHARVVGQNGSSAVVGFDNGGNDGLEWTGLLRVPGDLIAQADASHASRGHVFEMLAPHLPMQALHVRAREIDTPDDYDRALEWVAPIAHHWA
jgi:choline kinase